MDLKKLKAWAKSAEVVRIPSAQALALIDVAEAAQVRREQHWASRDCFDALLIEDAALDRLQKLEV